MRSRIRAAALTISLGLSTSIPAAASQDVTQGGRVETDLYTSDQSPPAALIDGDDQTHFAQHRLEDADWRVWLGAPSKLESIVLVQGWQDWSQALEVTLETADGTTTQLTLAAGTREPQSFPLAFANPTAFVDVRVSRAQPAKDGGGWGGFAELQLLGTPAGTDTTAPTISGIEVERQGESAATILWTTDEPATTQLRYSTEAEGVQTTTPELALTTSHSVTLQAASPLRGRIELRSSDASGNRAELVHDAFVTIDTSYQYGVGGWSFQRGESWIPAPQAYADDGIPHKFTQAWVGGDGWESWFDADSVAGIRAAGVTPEAIHYYFGDPTLEDVVARKDAFLADIDKLAAVLAASGVGDQSIVTLEPEYNQGQVAAWEGWNDLMIEAIQRLHAKAGAKVGLLAGDWDIEHVVPLSMGRAAAVADFVAFQEMRASTRDTPEDAHQVVGKAIRFAHYLTRKFLRPVRWGYVMVSDYGGWTGLQRDVVVELCERHQELQSAGVVAVSWMSYMDRPGSGGYFDEAEAHKGLKYSDNSAKPAFEVWRECVLRGPSWVGTGQPPPGELPGSEQASGCSCGLTSTPSNAWLAVIASACAAGLRRRTNRRSRLTRAPTR